MQHLFQSLLLLTLFCIVPVASATVIPLSVGSTNDSFPDISGNLLVWVTGTPQGEDIQLYNFSKGGLPERILLTTPGYTLLGKIYSLQISGNEIVWTQGTGSNNYTIFIHNLTTGKSKAVVTFKESPYAVRAEDTIIAWSECQMRIYRVGDSPSDSVEVFDEICQLKYHDLLSNMTSEFNPRQGFDYRKTFEGDFDLDDGRIVFTGSMSGPREVFLYNLSTTQLTQITNDTETQMFPRLSGQNIVWQVQTSRGEHVYLHNIETGLTKDITPDRQMGESPQIAGDHIVWVYYEYNNKTLYHYNIKTGIYQKISDLEYRYTPFSISSDRYVIWAGKPPGTDGISAMAFPGGESNGSNKSESVQQTPPLTPTRKASGSWWIWGCGGVIISLILRKLSFLNSENTIQETRK